MHFDEIGEAFADIVERVGALSVAGNLGDLPGCEVAVDVFGELQAFLGELVDFAGDIDRAFVLHKAQFGDFAL